MKFVVISDTHGQHRKLTLPKGDVLLHAGDISRRGEKEEILDFLNWFKELDFEYKLFIAGNHDFFFERNSEEDIRKIIPDNVVYLCDSGITIGNIKIWGSPVTPWFFNWAFNRHRGEPIAQHWNLIPADTDILITHGPVWGKLDRIKSGQNVGCEELLDKVKRINLQFYISGHIHEAYGQETVEGTTFINASVLDEKYILKNEPIVFDL